MKPFRRENRVLRHDFAQAWLWLDIDLTPLPISRQAEAGTKGRFAKKRLRPAIGTRPCATIPETLFSRIYPGTQDGGPTYMPILDTLETSLLLSQAQKQHTLLRSDAGFGSDANVNHAPTAAWQVLGKGKGGRQSQAYAQQVAAEHWQDLGHRRWVAPASAPVTYMRPTQHLVLRWQTSDGQTKYSTVVCSVLTWTPAEVIAHYDEFSHV